MNNILVKAYLKYHMEHGHTKNCLSEVQIKYGTGCPIFYLAILTISIILKMKLRDHDLYDSDSLDFVKTCFVFMFCNCLYMFKNRHILYL